MGYLGVDNWDAGDYAAALKKYVTIVDDHYNALCYDCGVAGESLPDPNSQLSLIRWLSERGKIEPRRKTGTCAGHQRELSVALKRARHVALLPYAPQHLRP